MYYTLFFPYGHSHNLQKLFEVNIYMLSMGVRREKAVTSIVTREFLSINFMQHATFTQSHKTNYEAKRNIDK